MITKNLLSLMINVESNNLFLKNKFEDLLIQKNYQLSADKKFLTIELEDKDSLINIFLNSDNFKFCKPASFEEIFTKISLLILKTKILFHGTNYYPFRQLIENKTKIYNFKNFNNILFSNLFLYPEGISKMDLYKKIWPGDKQVSINKLDTHLTNLKIDLIKSIDFDFKFQSKLGMLRLIID